jgi:hypothetical protein
MSVALAIAATAVVSSGGTYLLMRPTGAVDSTSSSSVAPSSRPSPESAAAATPTTTAQQSVATNVYTGVGNDVVVLKAPISELGILKFECPKCRAGQENSVKSDADIDGDLINNFSGNGPYSGKTWLNLRGGTETRLQVTAQGPWTITTGGLDLATQYDATQAVKGNTDDVFLFRTAPASAKATYSGRDSNFVVAVAADGMSVPDLVVNAIGSYDGRVMFSTAPGNALLVRVQAAGPWTITPDA